VAENIFVVLLHFFWLCKYC